MKHASEERTICEWDKRGFLHAGSLNGVVVASRGTCFGYTKRRVSPPSPHQKISPNVFWGLLTKSMDGIPPRIDARRGSNYMF